MKSRAELLDCIFPLCKTSEHVKASCALLWHEQTVERKDSRISDCVEAMLKSWDLEPSYVGLDETATEDQLIEAYRPLFHDYVWVNIVSQIDGLMDDLLWHAEKDFNLEIRHVTDAREIVAKALGE